jgi:DNA (cytosine-5)-methyltransferase 1
VKTHLDLFSGIGGFALAAGWAGYNTIGFCEIEDYPRRVLSSRFSGVPIHGDIRELDGSVYRGVSLITGGYPCQPFSAAGKRGGASDDRHLWPQMLRVIKQARPVFVVAENVAGHITLGLDEVLADLESEGYTGRAIVVPACAVNAPHRRDRVWIIARDMAHSGSGRRQGGELQAGRNEPGLCGTDVADTDSKRRRMWNPVRQDAEDAGQSSRSTQHGTGKFVGRLGGSLDGIPEGLDFPRRWGNGSWEDGVPRVTVGAKNLTQRLKALGNAIVPQVAYELIRHLETDG